MKNWWMILLIVASILLLPSIRAVVLYTGSLYSGSSFNVSGNSFTVIGVDPIQYYNNATDDIEQYYRSIIIKSSVDETVNMRNGTCYSTNMYVYCYTANTIDMNNPLTFKGDYLQSQIAITMSDISAQSANIQVTRPQDIEGYCGQSFVIPIVISNSGQETTNITYTEKLPANMVITSTQGGDVSGNAIIFRDTLWNNISRNYSYTINDLDCLSKSWSGQYSYNEYNGTTTVNLDNLTLNMQDSYNISYPLQIKSNDPHGFMLYTLNITNINPYTPLSVDLYINVPSDTVQSSANMQSVSVGNFRHAASVAYNSTDISNIKFKTGNYGIYNLTVNGTIYVGSKPFEYNAITTVIVVNSTVHAFIDVDQNKTANTPGNAFDNNTVHIYLGLENDDLKNTYYNIYGIFKDASSAGEEPLMYNNITPDTRVILLEKYYNLSNLTSSSISFDGIYRDYYGNEQKFHVERLLSKNFIQTASTSAQNNSVNNNENDANMRDSNLTENIANTVGTPSGISQNPNASNNSSVSGAKGSNKDFITSIIEGMSKFLQSIFG